MILGFVAVLLTACDDAVEGVSAPATTTTSSRPWYVPHTLTSTISPTGSAGTPVEVPDPASHKACRILNWSDLPADVRPADPSPHVTYPNDPEQCRIDNSLLGVGTDGGNQYFMARTLVSRDLSPIEKFAKTTAESTGTLITIGGEKAVERVWSDGSICAVYLEPAPEPFGVMIQNTRFPQHPPCGLARSLAEAILRGYR